MRAITEYSIALHTIEEIEQRELARCRAITSGNTLTQYEYARSTQAFKDLIDTPWKRGEPIYIVLEKDENEDLNPHLKRLMQEIKKGTYYSQFITVGSGTLWPLVLRLYYGLGCGFRISIEQMCAMLQVSYCLDAQLEIEHVPFFEGDSLRISRIGSALVQKIFSIEDVSNREVVNDIITTRIEPFRLAFHKVPNAEKCIQKITLDKRYFKGSKAGEIVFQAPPTLVNELTNSGLELFYMIVMNQNSFTSVYQENDKLFLLLPSMAMLKQYHQVIHPDRGVTYTSRLGIITPQAIEASSNLNQRIGSIYAPGITNPRVAHQTTVLPLSMYVHDAYYHFFLDAMLCRDTHAHLLYIVALLRTSLNDHRVMTSELRRCTDREFLIGNDKFQRNQDKIFPDIMRKIFSISSSSSKQISPSFVIIFVDALLNSDNLPYMSQSLERKFYKAFLHWDNLPTFIEFKDKVERYSREINGHSSKIAILILCRFYLNDVEFCQALVENMKHNMADLTVTWDKNSDKHLHPVFIRRHITRSLTDLKELSSIERIQEFAPILYPMPEYDDREHEALVRFITDQKGEVVIADSKITHFFMASSLLLASIRGPLKLERVKSNAVNERQIAYLKRRIPEIVIETVIEDKAKMRAAVSTLFTFPAAQRELVKSVLLEWEKLNVNATKIQAHYRGHAIRKLRLFYPVMPTNDGLERANSHAPIII